MEQLLKKRLELGIEAGVFVGGVGGVSVEGREPWLAAAGTVGVENSKKMENETLFDIASLTKPFIASAVLRLIDRQNLRLSEPLSNFFDVLKGSTLGEATIEQTLAHEAGFKAWVPFFEQIELKLRGTEWSKKQVFNTLLQQPAIYKPGENSVYSDLGYMVLGEIVERSTKKTLQACIEDEVVLPLGLKNTNYRPLKQKQAQFPMGPWESIAHTETCPWRRRSLVGEVHDDNAWTMGGIAGHAGLFSTVRDVLSFGASWLKTIKKDHWLPIRLARSATMRRKFGRALIFDLKTKGNSSAGKWMGPNTFGHLGFTGCSLWIDPDAELAVCLLTNRVCPSRKNEKIKKFRPYFHDAVVCALKNGGFVGIERQKKTNKKGTNF